VKPGVECKPGEELCGPPGRQVPALALDLDAQLSEQVDAQHLVSA
jgi:hypothetical protein